MSTHTPALLLYCDSGRLCTPVCMFTSFLAPSHSGQGRYISCLLSARTAPWQPEHASSHVCHDSVPPYGHLCLAVYTHVMSQGCHTPAWFHLFACLPCSSTVMQHPEHAWSHACCSIVTRWPGHTCSHICLAPVQRLGSLGMPGSQSNKTCVFIGTPAVFQNCPLLM